MRLDERVMQLFDLMNNLIRMNTTLRKKNLEVIRYNIIPMTNELGHNGGLIRWIEDSEPINSIIHWVSPQNRFLGVKVVKVRGRFNIDKRHEANLKRFRQVKCRQGAGAHNEDGHTLLQKIEQFQFVEHYTKDHAYHIAKGLWLHSPSAEVWFEKRTNFTRSLALNSMVGYILGLGDRHVRYVISS